MKRLKPRQRPEPLRDTKRTSERIHELKQLKISDDLSLPLDAATQTFAFIARKGAGKTYAAGKLAECLMDAQVQVVILDSVGNWWGLRLEADGKTPRLRQQADSVRHGRGPRCATRCRAVADRGGAARLLAGSFTRRRTTNLGGLDRIVSGRNGSRSRERENGLRQTLNP